MNKHAPGPWKIEVDPTSYWVTDSEGKRAICKVLGYSGTLEQNANLIAAAPDLLEALQEVVRISDRNHDAWDKAKAAIAKANGERQYCKETTERKDKSDKIVGDLSQLVSRLLL